MSSDRFDLTAGVEAAWVGFRGRLADHIAAMDEDETLSIDVLTGVDADELEGLAPYVLLCGFESDQVFGEAPGDLHLDERCALGAAGEEALAGIGWGEPDEDCESFTTLVPRREADRLAVMTVRTLREVYGVPHPTFLAAEGLEDAPEHRRPEEDASGPVEEVPGQRELDPVVFVQTPAELQDAVDDTVAAVLGLDAVQHDDDGDIVIRSGDSLVWVRVSSVRPAVHISAALVVGVEDLERLPMEVGMLNERHPFARFTVADRRVDLDYVLPAAPFCPPQLESVLRQVLDDVEPRAQDLIRRVGGRQLLTSVPGRAVGAEPSVDTDPGLVALLEVMHVRSMTSAGVAELFDHDRRAIVRALVALRTGRIECGEHDLDEVLEHLRRGLSHIAFRAGRDRRDGRGPRPSRPHSQQLSLLPEGGTLDEGQWEQGIS